MWTISSLYYRPIDWTVKAHAFVGVELCVGRNCLLPPFFLEGSEVNFELWSANQLMRRWRHSQLGWACENAATLIEFLILVWKEVVFPLVIQKIWIRCFIVRRTIFRKLSTGRWKVLESLSWVKARWWVVRNGHRLLSFSSFPLGFVFFGRRCLVAIRSRKKVNGVFRVVSFYGDVAVAWKIWLHSVGLLVVPGGRCRNFWIFDRWFVVLVESVRRRGRCRRRELRSDW